MPDPETTLGAGGLGSACPPPAPDPVEQALPGT